MAQFTMSSNFETNAAILVHHIIERNGHIGRYQSTIFVEWVHSAKYKKKEEEVIRCKRWGPNQQQEMLQLHYVAKNYDIHTLCP